MPRKNKIIADHATKIILLHNTFTEAQQPLSIGDVDGKFDPVTRSPASDGGAAASTAGAATAEFHPRISCDGHLHPTGYHQQGPSLLKMIQMANENNLKHFVAMKIPTNVISLQADRHYIAPVSSCGETYYLDAAMFEDEQLTREKIIQTKRNIELDFNSEVDWVQAAEYMKLTDDQKERIDLAITGLHLGDSRAHFSFFQKMASIDAPFSMVGEVTLAKEMVMHLLPHQSQARLKNHIKPCYNLIEMVGLTGMPITIHCDIDTAIPEHVRHAHPANLNGMMKLLNDTQTADTTIIWAHFGGIGRFGTISEKHYDNVKSLLHRFPQLMIDLSWSRVATRLDPGELAKVIGEHPDRFIMGSDALAPANAAVLGQTYSVYDQKNGLFDRLAPEVRTKLLETNYERVIRGGRENAKKFKQHILPELQDLLAHEAVDNFDAIKLREWMLNEFKAKDPDHYTKLLVESEKRSSERKQAAKYIKDNKDLLSDSSDGDNSPDVSTASRLQKELDGQQLSRSAEGVGQTADTAGSARRQRGSLLSLCGVANLCGSTRTSYDGG